MRRHPEVTIIVPVYNKERFVEESIDSALSQNFKDIEVICIDDCSSDGSLERLRALRLQDDRIKIFSLSSNFGAGNARNFGVSIAKGRFVAFLDADDSLPRSAIHTLYDLANKTLSDLVRGSMVSKHQNGKETQADWQKMPDRVNTTLAEEPKLRVPCGFYSGLYSRHFLVKNNLSFPELSLGEDPVFLARCMLSADSISLVSDITYVHALSGSDHSKRQSYEKAAEYIEHAEIVKELYFSAGHHRCWIDGYGPFCLEYTQWLLAGIADPDKRALLTSKAYCLWREDSRLALF